MTHADAFDERLEERQQLASQVASRTGVSDRVETALATVPRHAFVPPKRQHNAYIDRPLPIGDGQTISAPHMVAIMADLLECTPGEKVLEIGTGCGYHAAVTAELVGPEHVYSVEYSPDLAANAEDRLEELGYGEISIRTGDGREGWEAHAPYDAAYLTCGAPDFPEAVVGQIRPGGRLLGPLGSPGQTLIHAEKRDDGTLERRAEGAVRFVTMRG